MSTDNRVSWYDPTNPANKVNVFPAQNKWPEEKKRIAISVDESQIAAAEKNKETYIPTFQVDDYSSFLHIYSGLKKYVSQNNSTEKLDSTTQLVNKIYRLLFRPLCTLSNAEELLEFMCSFTSSEATRLAFQDIDRVDIIFRDMVAGFMVVMYYFFSNSKCKKCTKPRQLRLNDPESNSFKELKYNCSLFGDEYAKSILSLDHYISLVRQERVLPEKELRKHLAEIDGIVADIVYEGYTTFFVPNIDSLLRDDGSPGMLEEFMPFYNKFFVERNTNFKKLEEKMEWFKKENKKNFKKETVENVKEIITELPKPEDVETIDWGETVEVLLKEIEDDKKAEEATQKKQKIITFEEAKAREEAISKKKLEKARAQEKMRVSKIRMKTERKKAVRYAVKSTIQRIIKESGEKYPNNEIIKNLQAKYIGVNFDNMEEDVAINHLRNVMDSLLQLGERNIDEATSVQLLTTVSTRFMATIFK